MKKEMACLLLCLLIVLQAAAGAECLYQAGGVSVFDIAPIPSGTTAGAAAPDTVRCISACEVLMPEKCDAKVQIVFDVPDENEDLRTVRIESRKLYNVQSTFKNGTAVFETDRTGVYALIDMNDVSVQRINLYVILCALPAAVAVVIAVTALVRRKK